MEKEEWKPINDFEGFYEVSNFGRVRSLDRFVLCPNQYGKDAMYRRKGKVLKFALHRDNYWLVTLHKNSTKKTFLVHRLVASAFIPNPDNLIEINHIDENKLNNHVSNLEWTTRMQNVHHGTGIERMKTKLRCYWKPVLQISLDGCSIQKWDSISQAARALKIPIPAIVNACRGKYKSSHGYIWRYAEE